MRGAFWSAKDLSRQRNSFLRQNPAVTFTDVTHRSGLAKTAYPCLSAAWADDENDGDQDIYAHLGGASPDVWFHNAVFENPGNNNHWTTVRLIGRRSNRSAIRARIKIELENEHLGRREIHRSVGNGGSFGACSLQQEIGLGAYEQIKSLAIYWPTSKTTQRFENVATKQFIEVEEGADSYRVTTRSAIVLGDRTSPSNGVL